MENDNDCVISAELVLSKCLLMRTQAAAQARANRCEQHLPGLLPVRSSVAGVLLHLHLNASPGIPFLR